MMTPADRTLTTVVDAGARYGMHPSWRDWRDSGAALNYIAFEPDAEEARRLREADPASGFEVVALALGREEGLRTLYLTRHRGCCSFLKPDPNSFWFQRYRPGEGEIEASIQVETCSLDGFTRSRNLAVDFLKIDTEGTELEILQGATRQLEENVLGVRSSVYFQPCYENQPLFPEIHKYFMEKGFFLLNLDYFGRGVPRNSLFRNPDPLSPDTSRYGTLIGTDGVWLKDYRAVSRRHAADLATLEAATLKYAAFCMLNHATDVGLDSLVDYRRDRRGGFDAELTTSRLYRFLRRRSAEFLGRFRVYPDAQWETARSTFETIFGLKLEGGARYWEFLQSL